MAEAAATPGWVPFSQADVAEKIETVEQDQARGVIESAVAQHIVKKRIEVNISGPIGDKFFPLILRSTG